MCSKRKIFCNTFPLCNFDLRSKNFSPLSVAQPHGDTPIFNRPGVFETMRSEIEKHRGTEFFFEELMRQIRRIMK